MGAITLYDAIELARLLIRATVAVQSYSVDTGFGAEFPGIGGYIDTAVLLPDNEGFWWNQKK